MIRIGIARKTDLSVTCVTPASPAAGGEHSRTCGRCGARHSVCGVLPAQVTLVPDAENVITSNAGWDTIRNKEFLKSVCKRFKDAGIRVSIFVDPVEEMVKNAADCGCDRVELYTEAYAKNYSTNREQAIEPYYKAAVAAQKCGLGLNAGHDLNLDNLRYFAQTIPGLLEVSIGHALICDALYLGLENTIQAYRRELR